MKSVEILKGINDFELGQICDAVKKKEFSSGDQIIVEGEGGNEFYILEEGTAEARKQANGETKTVMQYEPGKYFGELALLKDAPRAATVVATVVL